MRMRQLLLLTSLSAPITSFSPPNRRINCHISKKLATTSVSKLIPCSKTDSQLSSSITDQTESILKRSDEVLVSRAIRVANHVPALASLTYFGLVSMASMMPMNNIEGPATLASVLVQGVGPTTNSAFSNFFPTLITPPAPVFLIWPLISVVQLVTVIFSALRPKESLLSQDDLSALSFANLASSAWLLVSSVASAGNLPLGSFLVLPLVPILSGFPLRKNDNEKITLRNIMFQIYSSFTTIASFLAFTVELQHGGRIPFFGGMQELNALIFLSLYAVNSSRSKNGVVKKVVNAGAISGILLKRLLGNSGGGIVGFFQLFLSASFCGTAAVAWISLKRLFQND